MGGLKVLVCSVLVILVVKTPSFLFPVRLMLSWLGIFAIIVYIFIHLPSWFIIMPRVRTFKN